MNDFLLALIDYVEQNDDTKPFKWENTTIFFEEADILVDFLNNLARKIDSLQQMLHTGEISWKSLVAEKNRQNKKLWATIKNLDRANTTRAIEVLQKARKEVNTEATDDGYVDVIWFDRYICNKIEQLGNNNVGEA